MLDSLFGANIPSMVTGTWQQISDELNLLNTAINVGWILLLLMFTYSALQAALAGRSEALRQLFISLLIAGTLLVSAPTINGFVRNAWLSTYAWTTTATEKIIGDVETELSTQLTSFLSGTGWATSSVAIGSLLVGSPSTPTGMSSFTSAAGASRTARLAGRIFNNLTRGVRFILIPIIAFFTVLIYMSGLIVLLGTLLLPLSAPLLLTRWGNGFLLNLSKRMIAAYASLAAIPLIFSTLLRLALINPLMNSVKAIEQMSNEIQAAWEGTPLESGFSISTLWDFIRNTDGATQELLMRSLDQLLALLNGLFEATIGSLLLLAGGLIAGMMLAQQMSNIISRFFDGIASNAGGNIRVPPRAGRMGRAGSSGQNSTSTTHASDGGPQGGGHTTAPPTGRVAPAEAKPILASASSNTPAQTSSPSKRAA